MYFQTWLIGIIGTSLASTAKVSFPKEQEISKKKFVCGNATINKLPIQMREPKLFEAHAKI